MRDLAAQPRDVVVADPQAVAGEVAAQVVQQAGVLRPDPVPQIVELALRPLAHQHVDRFPPAHEALDEVLADEPGPARDEVAP